AQAAADFAEGSAHLAARIEAATGGGEREADAAGQIGAQLAGIDAGRMPADGPAFRWRPQHVAADERMSAEQIYRRGLEGDTVLAERAARVHRHLRQFGRTATAIDVHLVRHDARDREGARGAAHGGIAAGERPAEIAPLSLQIESRAVLDDGN